MAPDNLICELCFPGIEDFGEILPGSELRLAKSADGQWLLFVPPYEGDSVVITFKRKPYPDPFYGLTDDEIDALAKLNPLVDEWVEHAEQMRELAGRLGLRGSAEVVRAALEAGYDRDEHGYLEFWLYHLAGVAASEELLRIFLTEMAKPVTVTDMTNIL